MKIAAEQWAVHGAHPEMRLSIVSRALSFSGWDFSCAIPTNTRNTYSPCIWYQSEFSFFFVVGDGRYNCFVFLSFGILRNESEK